MKKMKNSLVLLGVIAAMGLTPGLAQEKAPSSPPPEKPEKASQQFKGKVDAVDAKAKALTVDGKLIYTSESTKFTKAGKAITLAQVMPGDQVHGTMHRTADGKTEALTLKVGKEEEAKEDKDKPVPE